MNKWRLIVLWWRCLSRNAKLLSIDNVHCVFTKTWEHGMHVHDTDIRTTLYRHPSKEVVLTIILM
jgi:hypothetical protein